METKHTPGNWNYKQTSNSNGFNILDENNMPVALVYDSPGMSGLIKDTKTWEAKENAKLIASAPELLEALIDLKECIESLQGLSLWYNNFDKKDNIEMLAKTNAAINKATL